MGRKLQRSDQLAVTLGIRPRAGREILALETLVRPQHPQLCLLSDNGKHSALVRRRSEFNSPSRLDPCIQLSYAGLMSL